MNIGGANKINPTEAQRDQGRAPVGLLKDAGPFALAGLVLACLLLAIFAKLSEEVFSNEVTNLDNKLALWVHGFASPPLDTFFGAVSAADGFVAIALLTAVVFGLLLWRGHTHDAWRLALAVAGGAGINLVLKLFFHRNRPELWPGAHFAGFSFPSGHAAMSVCMFGMFMWLGWRYIKGRAPRAVWTFLMIVVILLVGLSRVYLGAHYPSDVLAGYLSSAVWLVLLLSGVDIYNRLRGTRKSLV